MGTHDGDCTRDWRWPGRGLFGKALPFRGTELLGLKLLAKAILARKTTDTRGHGDSSAEAPLGVRGTKGKGSGNKGGGKEGGGKKGKAKW